VYCRSHYVPKTLKTHRGAQLVVLPTLELKYTDTVIHSLLSILHAVTRKYDLILICNAANSIYAWLPRLFGVKVAVNVDGIERLRGKWNRLGKAYYRLGEYFSTWFPNAMVTDAKVIERYYWERYKAESVFIPYGTQLRKTQSRETVDRLGLTPGGYYLYVSRLEPENNAHLVVEAFQKVRTERKLLVVGDAPYSDDYIAMLRRSRDPRILFPGAIYGDGYLQLQANAFCYIHATEVGGTHPALIEAMGQGNIIVSNNTPENSEVLGGTGLLYQKNNVSSLIQFLQMVEDDPEKFADLRAAALDRARTAYSWDAVIDSYERLFLNLLKH
jgi:glycosyltransferase involved in cell wall biosynthesis